MDLYVKKKTKIEKKLEKDQLDDIKAIGMGIWFLFN